jgi:hypothetical protein
VVGSARLRRRHHRPAAGHNPHLDDPALTYFVPGAAP